MFVPGKILNRVILERMKDSADPLLRTNKQALEETNNVYTKLPLCALSSNNP